MFDSLVDERTNIKLVAMKCNDGSLIRADVATKDDGPFYCPETYEELIVRKCVDKVDHFAFKSRLSNIYLREETELHFSCKNEICSALQEAVPHGNWDVERVLGEDTNKGYGKVIPDIS